MECWRTYSMCAIERRYYRKIVLHGHLHSTNHKKEVLVESDVYNVSLLDENYDLIYDPLILDVNEHS